MFVFKLLFCEVCNLRLVVFFRFIFLWSVVIFVYVFCSQYVFKVLECYDIVELVRMFDLLCKVYFVKVKVKQMGFGVDNVLVKGILFGKSYFLQWRIFLMWLMFDESMIVRGVSLKNMIWLFIGCCKFVKKGFKKR